MFSVENFYWILYQNLLKPTGLDCWYYHPWGTQHNLSRAGEYQPFHRKQHANHVLFHFDQEPLWSDNLGRLYEIEQSAWSYKVVRVLANSEHSQLKTNIVKSRQMQDWYFFYHGFAALDWYRDTRYINDEVIIQDAFLSFNHVISPPRSYRIDLIARMIELGVDRKGKISLHADNQQLLDMVSGAQNNLSESSTRRIIDTLLHRQDFPLIVDQIPPNGDLSARCGHNEVELWQSSLLHVVNETVFYEPKLHLTEKVFKPIVAQRPFVLVAAPGNLAYLRSYGFQTFGDWIEEGYDTINDPDLRLQAIAKEIAKLSHLSHQQLRELRQEMHGVLNFNKCHFFGEFRKIIVDELVNNFETMTRVWNNGRVDGRQIPDHPDLDSVRCLLAQ